MIKTNNKKIGIAIADINMIDFFESINIDFYKVIRNDMLNDKLIKKLIKTNKKIIVSTGTCSEQEINKFIKKHKSNNITLNHTQLSHEIEDCNLLAIQKYASDKDGINMSIDSLTPEFKQQEKDINKQKIKNPKFW